MDCKYNPPLSSIKILCGHCNIGDAVAIVEGKYICQSCLCRINETRLLIETKIS